MSSGRRLQREHRIERESGGDELDGEGCKVTPRLAASAAADELTGCGFAIAAPSYTLTDAPASRPPMLIQHGAAVRQQDHVSNHRDAILIVRFRVPPQRAAGTTV